MKCRRAISLIELLLTMSACSVILTMSVTLIHRVMHAQSRARLVLDGERAALRLSEQFRQDVQAATIAESETLAVGTILRLQLPKSESVEYRREGKVILRIDFAGATQHGRELFEFPVDFDAVVQQDSAERVTLTLTTPLSAAGESKDAGSSPPAEVPVAPLSLQATARMNRMPRMANASEAAP